MDKITKLKLLYKLKESGDIYTKEIEEIGDIKMPNELKELEEICKNCTLCDLSKTRTNVVFGEGDPNAKIMFIGEAPGAQEDKTGRPFVGRSGHLLTKLISEVLNLSREDVYISNVVKCRPPNNRTPTIEEAMSCKPYLIKQIEIINPQILVCLGRVAFHYLLNLDYPITKIRGQIFQFKDKKVIPTFHPSFILRNPKFKPEIVKDFELIKSFL